jgi:hypothetical protein
MGRHHRQQQREHSRAPAQCALNSRILQLNCP